MNNVKNGSGVGIVMFILLIPGLVLGQETKLKEARCINASNEFSVKCLDPEEVGFRRKAFEDSALNYVEEILSSLDDKFKERAAFQRCRHLMELEFVEYPYRANILRARVLLRDLGSNKDARLFEILKEITGESNAPPKMEMLSALIDSIVSYWDICLRVGRGDEKTLDRLSEYVNELRKIVSIKEGEWVVPNR